MANSAEAFANLQNYQTQMKDPSAILASQNQQLGIPAAGQQVSGLRQAITNTTNLLNQIPQAVQGRTQNSLVTSGQANRQIQNEQAPVAQQLSQQSNDYNTANSDYERLIEQAKYGTDAELQGQQQKYGALKDIYTALYGSEQDSLAHQLEEKKFAESQRQFNATPHGSGGGGGLDVSSLLKSLGGGGGALPQGMSIKNPNAGGAQGYNFTFGGSPVSAATFANVSNQPISDILYTMAQSGDQSAAKAYQAILANKGTITPQIKSQYSSLFWGS